MNFLKSLFSSCLGAFLAMIAFFFFGFIIIGFMIAGLSAEQEVVIKNNSVLHLDLDAQITELQVENPFAGLPTPIGDIDNIGLLQLKEVIEKAKDDDKIEGIYLEVSYPQTYYSSLEEIRTSLMDFRSSGKWVIAYNEVMSEGAYYLSSVADKVYLNPLGEVEFNGLSAQFTSFKRLFDKLEINPQVFRVGEFKSAVEPFLREDMSDENRLQLREMIESIHQVMLDGVAESRGITKTRLKEIADQMLVRNAATALELNLIDSLIYQNEFHNVLRNRLGLEEDAAISFVNYDKYRKTISAGAGSKNEIAVVVAEGTIIPGSDEQSQQIIAADDFVKVIRKVRQDEDVKAIVLRINSPGGEVRASDMIWYEVAMAAKEKPVIASMGDFAASGGYYIAMACDTIVAEPQTVTGSIGIFGVMFDLSGFLGDKLGITFDEVKTGEYGEMYTVTRPLTEAERRHWQRTLDDYYDLFLTKAADGRSMSKEAIGEVASGRVWTGEQALERGLVDVLGGFNIAVNIAAEKAGIADDYKVDYYPKRKDFLEQFISSLEENAKVRALMTELGVHEKWYDQWNRVQNYQGAQARLPFELTIE